MLTAAVCGNVFASPPSSTVYKAIIRCAQDNPGMWGHCRFTDENQYLTHWSNQICPPVLKALTICSTALQPIVFNTAGIVGISLLLLRKGLLSNHIGFRWLYSFQNLGIYYRQKTLVFFSGYRQTTKTLLLK